MKRFYSGIIVLLQLFATINARSINLEKIESQDENVDDGPFLVEFYRKNEIHDKPYKISKFNGTLDDTDAIIIDGKPRKTLLGNKSSIEKYYRGELNTFQKMIYDNLDEYFSIDQTITGLKYKFTNLQYYDLPCNNYEDSLYRAYYNLVEDHPEFWYFQAYAYLPIKSNLENGQCIVTDIILYVTPSYTVPEINKINNEIKAVGEKIVKETENLPTLYEKLLYIHDFMIKTIKYTEYEFYDQTIYGALINKHCVCSGYADAFTYLSRLVGADVINGGANGHAWNFVKLDSKWYAVDVLWDDDASVYVDDDTNLSHNYFLVGTETKVSSDKTYREESVRDLSKIDHVLPPLSQNAYEPPQSDSFEQCKKRLSSDNLIKITSKAGFYNDVLYSSVCEEPKGNYCRFAFNKQSYLKCTENMNKYLNNNGINGEVCFKNKKLGIDWYCYHNEESSTKDSQEYEQCKNRIKNDITIDDKRKTKFRNENGDDDEIAHAACAPKENNHCRDGSDIIECYERMNEALVYFGHDNEVCFTSNRGGKKCYNNGRDSNDQMDYEQCKQRVRNEIEIKVKNGFNYNINDVAHKVCEPTQNNQCRYRFDFPGNGPNYGYFLTCTESINNVLNEMGNNQKVCFRHKSFSSEEKCYNNILDFKNKVSFEECKRRIKEDFVIDPKGEIKFEIDDVASTVCSQKQGSHCRYEFGKPENKEYYNNFIECTEDINNVLNDMGNDKEICYLHIDYSKKYHCYSNLYDNNQQMNYEQCKQRIRDEIEIEIKDNSSYDLEEVAHKACSATEGNRCRYRFDYPNQGVYYEYYLRCIQDIKTLISVFGNRSEVCFKHKIFSSEKKCLN